MKEEFAKKHAQICLGRRFHRSPSDKFRCGKTLYDFLIKYKIPLDIYYNQKKYGKLSTLATKE
jgi:hypothetical protein